MSSWLAAVLLCSIHKILIIPIIPLLKSFQLDEEIKPSIETHYKSIYLVNGLILQLLKAFDMKYMIIEMLMKETHKEFAEFAPSLLILPNSNAEVERYHEYC